MNIVYYCTRAHDLGITGCYSAIKRRIDRYLFDKMWRKKALAGKANHTWDQVAQKHRLNPSFEQFWKNQPAQKFFYTLIKHPLIARNSPTSPTNNELFSQANHLRTGTIQVLDYQPFAFKNNIIDWHTDHQAAQYNFTSPEKWHNAFYQDITITPAKFTREQHAGNDVKTCWELSRLHHLVTLGMANSKANEKHRQHYAATFRNHLLGWILKNPYLVGINWLCPMEVAIRAINIIWSMTLLKNDPSLNIFVWQVIVCSLEDHRHFLEHNLETSDRPNNHLLADLLGLAYLELFFTSDIKKDYQTQLHDIAQKFNKQIADDGTSYEGSTAYHRLVYEMLTHLRALFDVTKTNFPASLERKHDLMKQFLAHCTDHGGTLATIGDNDSGKIIFGIAITPPTLPQITTYQNFGLTTVRTNHWHVTFRHPVYQDHQPSGHFHQDQLSITISIDQQPIFIDPGSYQYTGHAGWRNYFRSWQHHNTFGIVEQNTISDQQDLFSINLPQTRYAGTVYKNDNEIIIEDSFQSAPNLPTAWRKVHISDQEINITDWWQATELIDTNLYQWNFICSPEIDIETKNSEWISTVPAIAFSEGRDQAHDDAHVVQDDKNYILTNNNQAIAQLQSTIIFDVHNDISSPIYGQSNAIKKLTACTKKQRVCTKIRLLV